MPRDSTPPSVKTRGTDATRHVRAHNRQCERHRLECRSAPVNNERDGSDHWFERPTVVLSPKEQVRSPTRTHAVCHEPDDAFVTVEASDRRR